jgi:hypothetical protein
MSSAVSEDPPLYTEDRAIIWVEITVTERWIDELHKSIINLGSVRLPRMMRHTLPLTLDIYAALVKVSSLVASRIFRCRSYQRSPKTEGRL